MLIAGTKHSGKSLCARALGKLIDSPSVDLDELVQAQTGKSPRELFCDGKEFFQKAEAQALASLFKTSASRQNCLVISAGGGIVDNEEAMALLRSLQQTHKPFVVCLDVSAETAWQRILDSSGSIDGELPPFLNTGNPKETHLALHKRRAEAYKAMAAITISADNMSPEEIAAEIAKHLPEF